MMNEHREVLWSILACPNCKSSVRISGNEIVCTGPRCGLVFPMRNDIPVMLISEARKPEPHDPRRERVDNA